MGYKPRAKPDFSLLQGARAYRDYQPTQPGTEQNPPQSVSGIIPYGQRIMAPQSYDPNRSTYVPPMWGVTAQEFVNAITGYHPVEPIEHSSDGIAPCGYEEL